MILDMAGSNICTCFLFSITNCKGQGKNHMHTFTGLKMICP